MKYYILLLLAWLTAFPLWAQMAQPFLFEDSLCVNSERPLLLVKGMEVMIGCDSAYLINPRRYALYQRLHRHIREVSAEGNCQPLLEAYEKALLETQAAYESLHKQQGLTDQLAGQWLRESEQAIKQMQQTLGQAEQKITQASQHLTEAQQMIKEERRRNILSKALIGLSGVGIGLLIAY